MRGFSFAGVGSCERRHLAQDKVPKDLSLHEKDSRMRLRAEGSWPYSAAVGTSVPVVADDSIGSGMTSERMIAVSPLSVIGVATTC